MNRSGRISQAIVQGSCSAAPVAGEARAQRHGCLDVAQRARQRPEPAARRAARCAGVHSACAVSSSVASTTGRPQASSTASASGSFSALNSAAGVALPSPQAPVISTIRSTFAASAGSVISASARLVAGAMPTSVTGCVGVAQDAADRVGGDARRRLAAARQCDAAEAIDAVHARLVDEGAEQRPVGAGVDRHIRAGERGQRQRVGQRAIQPDIAAGHGDRQQLELRRGQRQKQRERVVGARDRSRG